MDLSNLKAELKKAAHDFVYGFAIVGPSRILKKQIRFLDFAFLGVTLGDMLGLPVFPPIYKYRLLPHFLPLIDVWKKSILKEKEVTWKMLET